MFFFRYFKSTFKMEETVVLSPLEILLLNYRDLTEDQELLKDLDYVTLMNLCSSSTTLRERCQASDIQALLKEKERESAFIILRNLIFMSDTSFDVDMVIQYPKLLKTTLLHLRFQTGEPSIISGNTIDSDIESLVDGRPFIRNYSYLHDYRARYIPSKDTVYLGFYESTPAHFEFSAPLYHRILITILELYNLEYAIALEGGERGQQEIYIHV